MIEAVVSWLTVEEQPQAAAASITARVLRATVLRASNSPDNAFVFTFTIATPRFLVVKEG
ncbi:hypothetical protein Q1M64_13660 (plasmid) [Sinorhizobium meliloti]|nr:hypothetical protein Q1M64_13660 [Sinorhizobium meliloti]